MRRLLVLPIALLLATALVTPSYAASKEGLSGYNHPSTGKKETKPAKNKETPPPTPATPEPAKASSLPFTGFDLRWTVGFGLVLVGAGGSILVMQRRQRHSDR